MAESPIKITRSDDGLSVRCEFDARYISDEAVQRIRGYIDQLETENAKLQDKNARLRSRLSDEFAENARMTVENAKLRELVQKMMRFMEDGDWCTTCEVAKECDEQEQYEGDCLMRGVFHDRMRELGVEVD